MTENGKPDPRLFPLFATAGLAVAGWKVAALALASGGSSSDGGIGSVEVLLALVGLIFVACGLVVLRQRPGRESVLFAGFCLCAGLHWGGPLELPSGPLRTGLVFFYLLVSSLLAEALFLHFALSFPRTTRAATGRLARALLYGPVVLGALLAVVAISAYGSGGQVKAIGQGGFLLLHLVVSNLFPALALGLYVAYLVRRRLSRAEKSRVGLMVAGMLAAWLPYLVASAAGAPTDPWNLAMAVLPIAFTVAILGLEGARIGDRPKA